MCYDWNTLCKPQYVVNYENMTVIFLCLSLKIVLKIRYEKTRVEFVPLIVIAFYYNSKNNAYKAFAKDKGWSSVRKRLYRTDCRNGLAAGKGRLEIFEAALYYDVSLHKKMKEGIK